MSRENALRKLREGQRLIAEATEELSVVPEERSSGPAPIAPTPPSEELLRQLRKRLRRSGVAT